MMKFGLYLGKVAQLVDMETGEILAWGAEPIRKWLAAYEGNYTLVLIQSAPTEKNFKKVLTNTD